MSAFVMDGAKISNVLEQVADMSPWDGDDVCWSCGTDTAATHETDCAYRQACELLGRKP